MYINDFVNLIVILRYYYHNAFKWFFIYFGNINLIIEYILSLPNKPTLNNLTECDLGSTCKNHYVVMKWPPPILEEVFLFYLFVHSNS